LNQKEINEYIGKKAMLRFLHTWIGTCFPKILSVGSAQSILVHSFSTQKYLPSIEKLLNPFDQIQLGLEKNTNRKRILR